MSETTIRVVVRGGGGPELHTTATLVTSQQRGVAKWETWEVDNGARPHPRFRCYEDQRANATATGNTFGRIPQGYIYAKGESK